MGILVTAQAHRQRDDAHRQRDERSFLLQRAQPAMTGLIDGSLSTLAPIFAVAVRHPPAALCLPRRAGHRGRRRHQHGLLRRPVRHREPHRPRQPLPARLHHRRGTFLGGVLHTLPFLIPAYHAALIVALAAVAFELVTLASIRARFFSTSFFRSFISVALGGATIAAVSAALGAVG